MSGEGGEFHYEIYAKCVPSRVQNLERVQFAYQSLPHQFRPEAEVTGADVLSDVPRHLRPPVILRD